jgi:hypothetical protein
MPENQIPATQPEPEATAGEFNFTKPASENPRIKRRSLKGKPAGLIKPAGGTPPAARELEREAPPLSAEQAKSAKPEPANTEVAASAPAAKVAETPVAPPKTTPSPSTTTGPALQSTALPTASSAGPASSPHGTRPATLYYSNPTKKAETSSPMKTIPTAGAASSTSSASSTTLPSTTVRPSGSTTASRPSPSIDYRANVERQSREQKSVGSILSYVVYGLIAFFVISAVLAAYGADVIFKQLHDQSVTVNDLDARYAAANKDLNSKLATTQDTLSQAQAQIGRQQDLIVKQQEELNRLIAATTDNDTAIRAEKQARAQEASNLRSRIKDLEYRTSEQKY